MFKSKSAKNGSLYIFASIVTNIIPVVSIAIFTRLLSPDDYGYYTLSLLYGSFLVSICNFGLQIGYERDFFEKDERNNGGLLYATILFVFGLTLMVGLILWTFNDFWSQLIFKRPDRGLLFFWAFGYLGLAGVKNYFLIYYKNAENAKSYLLYSVAEGLISLPISFVLIRFMRMGVMGLIVGQFAAALLVLCFVSYRVSRKLKLGLNIAGLKKSFLTSLPLTPKIFFGVLSTNLDKILLGSISALHGLGIYNLGQKIGYVAFTYTVAIYNVFSPRVYNDMFSLGSEGGKVIGPYLTKFFYITTAGVFLIGLFSEELILLITPPEYHGAVEIATIFAMLYSTYFFGTIPQLIYAKKTGLTSWLSLAYIIVNFYVIMAFIPRWGAIGAAWGSLVSGVITGLAGFLISQRYYKIQWEYRKILVTWFFFSASCVTLVILRQYQVNFVIRFLYKLGILGVFFWIGRLYNLVPVPTLSGIGAMIRSRFSGK